MNLKSLASRVKSMFGAENQFRGPFFGMGELGGWAGLGPTEDGWQRNMTVDATSAKRVAPVYACVQLYARAISQCTPKHMKTDATGKWENIVTSPASRIFRSPNAYETWAQFVHNAVSELLFEGETLFVAIRDNRFAITAVHRIPRTAWSIYVEPETKEVFYSVSANGSMMNENSALIPARDCAHLRIHCPRHPMIGESPIKAAALAVGINVALNRSQIHFFSNMNRPSGILSVEKEITADGVRQLRERFNEQSKSWAQGGMPILGNGTKFYPVNISQADSQLIEQQKLSMADIARVFGVPMALISDNSGPQGATETLIQHWLSIGLGSVIESIERSLDKLFDLGAYENVQLDTTPLLRADIDSRMGALAKAVQGGIMTVNEARAREMLPPVEGGENAFLQRQMTPVSLISELNANELKANAAPAPAPAAAPEKDPAEPAKAAWAELVKSYRESE